MTTSLLNVAPLFRPLEQRLLELLRPLSSDDWRRPTVCSQWSVQDIAAHLLDGAIRRISAQRDRYLPPERPPEINSSADLLVYLTELNTTWTRASRRISPPLLIDLLEVVSRQYVALWESVDPDSPALFPVSWLGEAKSLMSLDMARDYTERWHHQRQIALALNRETPIDARELYHPVLDIFMRALPHTFRDTAAPAGAVVSAQVDGPAGGVWYIERHFAGWRILETQGAPNSIVARAALPQDVAWRVFTKRLTSDAVLQQFPAIRLEGDSTLARRVLEMVSIVA